MNKPGRIISAILIVFALSSLVIYRLRLGDGRRHQSTDTSRVIKSEVKMIEGQICDVDTACFDSARGIGQGQVYAKGWQELGAQNRTARGHAVRHC